MPLAERLEVDEEEEEALTTRTDTPSVEPLEEAEERRRADRRGTGAATALEPQLESSSLYSSSEDGGGLRFPAALASGAWSAGGTALLAGKSLARKASLIAFFLSMFSAYDRLGL